jgi:DprA/Smf-like nucleotide binding protein involved in DNA uptake
MLFSGMDNTECVSPRLTSSPPDYQSIWLRLVQAAGAERAAAEEAERDYRSSIATPELIVEIRRLLASERRAERLVCRYLADMADRLWAGEHSELSYYDDEYHAARSYFGLGEKETRERIRIGRALRRLPRIERAFISGVVSYSRVREISRVAQPDTESRWLELARTLDMRMLERRVAATRQSATRQVTAHADARPATPTSPEARNPATAEHDAVSVTFELSAEAWQLVQRALDATRAGAATPLTDSEALEALARNALGSPSHGDAPPPDRPAQRSGDGAARVTPVDPSPDNASRNDGSDDPVRADDRAQQSEPDAAARDLLRRLGFRSDPTSSASQSEASSSSASGRLGGPLKQLLEIIGRRPRWTTDDLVEASGLTTSQVLSTITLLELGRHLRRDGPFLHTC